MKYKYLLLLFLVAVISVASTVTVSRVIVKPERPIIVFVRGYNRADVLMDDMRNLPLKGWEQKSVSITTDKYGGFQFGILSMYKYE